MRIVHIITRMIVGGAQENTLLNCLDLQQQYGDDVTLLTGPSLGPEGDLLGQGRGGELPVVRVDSLRRPINPLRDALALQALLGHLRKLRPDVVHTHSAKGGVLGRQAAARLAVPAVIHSVHGAPIYPAQGKLQRRVELWAERWAARQTDRFICVADAMRDLLVDVGITTAEKCVTIYSGMDVEPFLGADQHRSAARAELGLEPQHIVIGKIARLFHLKGHDDLITAAQTVCRQHPSVRFLLVGDGLLRSQLEQRIERLGLRDRFLLTGLVPPERIPYYIAAMDVLVHTSRREGLARALPQALIAGRPVVSYDIDGAREVAIDNETGFLIAAGDTDSLADRIGRLARSPEDRARMGRVGQQRFTETFRHETMTRQIRRVYQDVLAEKQQAC